MSTKMTIRWREPSDHQPGYHLFEDGLDIMADEVNAPIYLSLSGVQVDLTSLEHGGVDLTLTLPRELARELGLIEPADAPDETSTTPSP